VIKIKKIIHYVFGEIQHISIFMHLLKLIKSLFVFYHKQRIPDLFYFCIYRIQYYQTQ